MMVRFQVRRVSRRGGLVSPQIGIARLRRVRRPGLGEGLRVVIRLMGHVGDVLSARGLLGWVDMVDRHVVCGLISGN